MTKHSLKWLFSIGLSLGVAMIGASEADAQTRGGELTANKAIHLEPATPVQYAHYGQVVVIDGDTLVIGAPGEGDGVVYIYERNRGGADNWGFVRRLEPPEAQGETAFGESVVLQGDILVVGAPKYDEDSQDFRSGVVWAFERDEGGEDNWGQVARIEPLTPKEDLRFGQALALDGDTLAVGFDQGVGIYEHDPLSSMLWSKVTDIVRDERQAFFGSAVALAGDTLAVAAPAWDRDLDDEAYGAIFFYERDHTGADAWGEVEMLVPSDTNSAQLGEGELAAQSDSVMAGAWPQRVDDIYRAGAVHVFARQGAQWTTSQQLTSAQPADADLFGRGVGLDGSFAVVGVSKHDAVAEDAGQAVVFSRTSDATEPWQQAATFAPGDLESRDYFGTSVSVAGRYVAVGAPTLEGAGSAYVFWLNHTPTVTDDAVTTDEDVSVVVDVLANDLDEDGDALTLTIAAQPDEGVASVTADGEVEYVPSSGFVGQTSFEYQLEDEFGATSNATVTVTVEEAQDTPDAGHSDTDLADTGSPDTGEVDAGSSDVGHADARLDDDATKSPEGCSCTSIDGNDSPGGAVAGLLVLLLGGWVRRTRRR